MAIVLSRGLAIAADVEANSAANSAAIIRVPLLSRLHEPLALA